MKKIPQRKCVGCRQMFNKSDLIRICNEENGQGRGAYVCNNPTCIEQARKTKGIERSLKQSIAPHLYEDLLANQNMLGG